MNGNKIEIDLITLVFAVIAGIAVTYFVIMGLQEILG